MCLLLFTWTFSLYTLNTLETAMSSENQPWPLHWTRRWPDWNWLRAVHCTGRLTYVSWCLRWRTLSPSRCTVKFFSCFLAFVCVCCHRISRGVRWLGWFRAFQVVSRTLRIRKNEITYLNLHILVANAHSFVSFFFLRRFILAYFGGHIFFFYLCSRRARRKTRSYHVQCFWHATECHSGEKGPSSLNKIT